MPIKTVPTVVALIMCGLFSKSFASETKLALNIESVTTQGEWEFNGKKGSYRFILYQYGFEHVIGELWVQWLQWETDNDDLHKSKVLVAEKPIAELNNLRFSLAQPVCVEPWPCLKYEIEAFSTFESVPNKKYIFEPTDIGKYNLEEVDL